MFRLWITESLENKGLWLQKLSVGVSRLCYMDKPAELMSDAELARALDQADADLALLETRRLRLVAAMDSSGYAERVGARDMVQYLEFRYRLDRSRAFRDVRLARALPKYPAVTAALPDPDVPDDGSVPEVLLRPAQAEAIVTALEKVPTTVPVADVEFAEQELVRLARHLSPTDLRKAAEQSRDILDTDGPEPEEHKTAARETLTLKTADRGVKFTGYLANENAELLRTMITAGARPHKTLDGERDPRSREKRQADAPTTTLTLAATALDAGIPSPTMSRPTMPHRTAPGTTTAGKTDTATSSASDPDTSAAETPNEPTSEPTNDPGNAADNAADNGADNVADRGAVAGQACDGVGGSRGYVVDTVPGFGAKANITVTIDFQDLKAATADAIGHTVYSNGLSAATIRRLACDAKVIPIVLGSNSEPLDVGRCERLVTRAMRRALNTRDRGCVICGAPPVMCDAHHLISWIDGGETKTSNLALVRLSHESSWPGSRLVPCSAVRACRSGGVCLLQLEEVVDCADEAPFAVHGWKAAPGEAPESEVVFDVAEDGFDARGPFLVELGAAGFGEFGVHCFARDRRVGGFATDVGEHGV
ncbi:uncharacterized protein DUF222, partial [Kribbella sp. VKM Ac-2571]